MLFMADATTKGQQPVFYIKLSLIALALWNTVLARRTGPRGCRGTRATPDRWRVDVARCCGLGAITAGRLMAYM